MYSHITRNQIRINLESLGLFWFDFLSCGCTTWFCIKRFIHIVNTSPAFPQNVHIQVAQTRYCKPTKIASLSEQRYNCCKLQLISFHVAVHCTTWSRIQRLSHIVCTAPTFPQNGNLVHVHKFMKAHLTHHNVFLIRFVVQQQERVQIAQKNPQKENKWWRGGWHTWNWFRYNRIGIDLDTIKISLTFHTAS